MISSIDHVTIVVTELDASIALLERLGFVVDKTVFIEGPVMEEYLGVAGIEADHVILVIPGSEPRQEVQLLLYHRPAVTVDGDTADLCCTGYNHLSFRVDHIEAAIATLTANGIPLRNRLMMFNDRKLVFFEGPACVTLELAEWLV